MQKIRDRQPELSYPMEWDNLAAVPVSTFDHWWTKQIDNKTRNMSDVQKRKASPLERWSSTTRWCGAFRRFTTNRPSARANRSGTIKKACRCCPQGANETFVDRSTFITASLGDRVIGFAKLVPDEDHQQAALMQILSMVSHRDKSPTNALIAQAVRSCAERGIPYLVYASFAYDNKLRDSLSDFKQHNGFQRIDVAQVLRAAHDERPDSPASGSASFDHEPHSRAGAHTTAGDPRLVVRAQHPGRESRRRTIKRSVNA